MDIERAGRKHLPEIEALGRLWRLTETTDVQQGFLVADYTLEDLRGLLEHLDVFLVALHNGRVAGYVMAQRETLTTYPAPLPVGGHDVFLRVRQVCRHPEIRLGAARALYQRVLQGWPDRIVAGVVDDPVNVRSQIFHRATGFRLVGRWEAPPQDRDGVVRPRGLWMLR